MLLKNNNNYISYESINLDINIIYIINKIKVIYINDLSILFNYNLDFFTNKICFDDNKYDYNLIKINKLIVGIEGTIIEEVFPKNQENIYSVLIQYEKDKNINKEQTLDKIKPIFCLLLIENKHIDNLNEQEIALYLFTLQYYNYLLKSYKRFKWINNLLAIVKTDNESFLYSLKINEKEINDFYYKCKKYEYDFNDIIIEKYILNTYEQKKIIDFLNFGVFDLFNHNIFKENN